jgi:hypothetical protein
MSGAEFFGARRAAEGEETDGEDEDDIVEIDVWWINWNTFEVFRICQPQLVGGMGVWWHGVGAAEVYAGCKLLRIKQREWPEIVWGVQYMARVVADYRNEEASKERERITRK